MPIAFVIASIAGTGIHLASLNLPLSEAAIAASVLVFGILLALKTRPHRDIIVGLAALAGVFHGFAYGEAIFGADRGPLIAYLLGFAAIQLAIAAGAWWIGKTILEPWVEPSGLAFRFAGFAIGGIGVTFLTSLMVETIFPA
jgi:urease accessory protein